MQNKRLCIVAHPDDEIIFLGNDLSLFPTSWHVVCVTNGNNLERATEFKTVMEQVGCSYEIWPLYDKWKVPLDEDELNTRLRKLLEHDWEIIATHDQVGDKGYEHPHHRQVHEAVIRAVDSTSNVYCFSPDEYLEPQCIQKKLSLLSNYKSQINLYGFIFIPLLEEYFFKEGLKKYESSYCRN